MNYCGKQLNPLCIHFFITWFIISSKFRFIFYSFSFRRLPDSHNVLPLLLDTARPRSTAAEVNKAQHLHRGLVSEGTKD